MSYIQNTASDVRAMLEAIGIERIEDLFRDVPAAVRLDRPLEIPPGLDEHALLAHLYDLGARNEAALGHRFLGAGAYDHYTPSVVDQLAGRSEFVTAYTPYQPEASQGVLQATFEYQTFMAELTGMDVSNAGLYDGATATCEGANMACDITRRDRVVAARTVHPEYRAVLTTAFRYAERELVEAPRGTDGRVDQEALAAVLDDRTACLIAQSPNFYGCVEEMAVLAEAAHRVGALFVAVVDPVSLAVLAPPGEVGADVAVGDAQTLGNELCFGGPHLGFLAARTEHLRRLPGRIVGEARDEAGQRAYVLTLQTREQHIRREKASSNICTNQALMALRTAIHLAALGSRGLREVAEGCMARAAYAAARLREVSGLVFPFDAPFFREFVVRFPSGCRPAAGLDLGRFEPDLEGHTLLAFTETTPRAHIDELVTGLMGGRP